MTQEDKQVLLKDLCSRLPYGVKVRRIVHTTDVDTIESVELFGPGRWLEELYAEEAEFFPYLRPLESMTKEERHEIQEILRKGIEIHDDFIKIVDSDINTLSYLEMSALFNLLNSHHFDYCGLIKLNLAIIAPEGMYNLKMGKGK